MISASLRWSCPLMSARAAPSDILYCRAVRDESERGSLAPQTWVCVHHGERSGRVERRRAGQRLPDAAPRGTRGLVLYIDVIVEILTSLLAPIVGRGGDAVAKQLAGRSQGGTVEQRLASYDRLRRACVDLRTTLPILWTLPLTAGQAVLSLPVLYRQVNRIPDIGTELNDAFLGVATLGSPDVVAKAASLAEELQKVCTQQQASAKTKRRHRTPADWTAFDEALGRFVQSTRKDLGIAMLDPQRKTDPSTVG